MPASTNTGTVEEKQKIAEFETKARGKNNNKGRKGKDNVGTNLSKNTTPYFLGREEEEKGRGFIFFYFFCRFRWVFGRWLDWAGLTSHVPAADQWSDAVERLTFQG